MKNILPEVLFAFNEVIMEETMKTMLSFLSLKFMSLSMCGRIIKHLFLLSVVKIFDVQQPEILKQHLQHQVQNPGPNWVNYRKKCHGEIHLCQITNAFENFIFNVYTSFYVISSIHLISSNLKQGYYVVQKIYTQQTRWQIFNFSLLLYF